MASLIMSVQSASGASLDVYEHKIVIKRKGLRQLLSQGLKGEKEIPIKHITSIQFKSASMLLSGYIQFTLFGGAEAKGGWQQAGLDENTVEFLKREEPQFRKIKDYLDATIEAMSTSALPNTPTQTGNDPIAQLERLASLRSQGVLSDDEFAAQKAILLGTKPPAPAAAPPPARAPRPVPTAERTIPCPNCNHPLRLSTIKIGDNLCPQCKEKFVAEE